MACCKKIGVWVNLAEAAVLHGICDPAEVGRGACARQDREEARAARREPGADLLVRRQLPARLAEERGLAILCT